MIDAQTYQRPGNEKASSMLVADVGDGLCRWQLCHVGDQFECWKSPT